MSKVIIWTNENGNVSVCTPTGEMDILDVKSQHTPSASIIVDSSSLPNDANDFFDAWRLIDGKVSVDLSAAKDMTKARLRFERTPLLAEQDVLYQRALETGSDTVAIVTEKNRLRDLPLLADDCTTIIQLRNLSVKA